MTDETVIRISDILNCNSIIIDRNINSIKDLIELGISFLYQQIQKTITLKTLKEKISKTPSFNMVFENGLFFPHIKIKGIDDFKTVLIVTPQGVKPPEDNNEDNKKIYITFMFFSPLEEKYFEKHLKILSLITSVFKDNVDNIIKMNTSQEICSYLKSI